MTKKEIKLLKEFQKELDNALNQYLGKDERLIIVGKRLMILELLRLFDKN